MKKKRRRKKVELMIPSDVLQHLREISELAGVNLDDTINIILATKIVEMSENEKSK